MSADTRLHNGCKEWRRLAEAEGEAIRARDWGFVADCQKALQQLQPQIHRHLQDARQEWARSGSDAACKEESFRAAIAELIEIERRNGALLDVVRRAARAHLGELAQAGRTLRQVQRSYAPPQPSAWTSFS